MLVDSLYESLRLLSRIYGVSCRPPSRSLAQKDDELLQQRQLNHQLRCRIRELEREIESEASPVVRDSYNSLLLPSPEVGLESWRPVRTLGHDSQTDSES